ncbi:MAG: DUF1571 domain-containing protein [Planctomycetaceae bacterium]|nr:DUF1571 domain-containing protein [Planctomycetaceae bacterium]MBT6483372.1 DUF1571 domain-containing protein [Planctomycetaceae bacterium]MBT6493833.1 DUF1571 domain-containing protein [Planctomycetaceae bacterium]
MSAAAGVLYFQFSADPGDGVPDEVVDIARLTAVDPIEVTSPSGDGEAGSAQASVSDIPAGMTAGGSNTLLEGRMALLMNLLLIERGHARLSAVPDYTAMFMKQERIGDELGEAQVIRIKLRHEPFSVYMKWLSRDKGRELVYVEGENNGKMLVHVGGWKARLLPTVKLDPHGKRAMEASRHPVTDAGLLEVARRCVAYRQRDLKAVSGVRCRMLDNQKFDDRDCYCFIIEYDRPELSEGYRKVVAHIDKEYSLPVSVKNYGWPKGNASLLATELDAQTLVEVYSYSEIRLRSQLAEADFSRHNKAYRFR